MENLKTAKLMLLVMAALGSFKVAPRALAYQTGTTEPAQPSLDFETYRVRIEPIFLKAREGGVRCYDCHSVMATRLPLEQISPGSSSWTPEQSRRNFNL